MSVTITVDIDGTEIEQVFDPVETFQAAVRLPSAAADTSLPLGAITDPAYLIVVSDSPEVTFKLKAAGTDPIACHQVAVLTETEQIASLDEILLSNAGGGEAIVRVWAGEE